MTAPMAAAAAPLVSIVMTVRDGEAHLEESLRSIQAQSHRRWELIVVDDGSSDRSADVADRFAARDGRIRVVRGAARGRGAAANVGVEMARGDLLARMDADDIALPDRLSVQIDWMRRTGVDVAGGWAVRFGEANGLWWVPEGHEAIVRELLVGFPLVNSATIARADVMRAHRYREDCACEDQELWGRLALDHRLGNVPAVLVKYRCHPGQVTRIEATRLRADHRVCRARLFAALCPDAAPGEARALDRAAEWTPCTSAAELEDAGSALVRLARCQDPGVRARMLEVWRRTCRRSAHLGDEADRLYRRVAVGFDVADGGEHPSTAAAPSPRPGRWIARRARPRRPPRRQRPWPPGP